MLVHLSFLQKWYHLVFFQTLYDTLLPFFTSEARHLMTIIAYMNAQVDYSVNIQVSSFGYIVLSKGLFYKIVLAF
jgi:hypothetical protein